MARSPEYSQNDRLAVVPAATEALLVQSHQVHEPAPLHVRAGAEHVRQRKHHFVAHELAAVWQRARDNVVDRELHKALVSSSHIIQAQNGIPATLVVIKSVPDECSIKLSHTSSAS